MDMRGVRRSSVAAIAAVLGFAATGCWTNLPAPAAPAMIAPIPPVDIGPPPAGATTVLFDADQPSQVTEVGARLEATVIGSGGAATTVGTVTRPVCLTPCAAHLARGTHQLVFSRLDRGWGGDGVLQLGMKPTAYRYALGHRNPHLGARIGGWVLFGLGLGVTATGAAYWSIGSSDSELHDSGLASYGQVQTFVGAGLVVVGVAMLAVFRPELQPGTGVQWELEAPPIERPTQAASR